MQEKNLKAKALVLGIWETDWDWTSLDVSLVCLSSRDEEDLVIEFPMREDNDDPLMWFRHCSRQYRSLLMMIGNSFSQLNQYYCQYRILKGFLVGRNDIEVSHLQYVDDMIYYQH